MSKSKKASVEEWVKWAEDRHLSLTKEEVAEEVAKYNEIIASTAPFDNGYRLKPINHKPSRTSNHAVGEVYKPTALNTHDPDNKYRWADEEANAPAWVWALRVLGTLGFVVGIYMLTLLTFLF